MNINTSAEFKLKQQYENANAAPDTRGIIYKIALSSLLIFIFTIPWGDGVFDGLARVVGVLSFGMGLFYFVTTGINRNFSYYYIFVILLWSWIILTVAWTTNIERGVFMASRMFQLMLLPFLFALILNNRNSHIMAYQSYVLGSIVGSSIIINNYLHGIESYYNRYSIANIETDTMSIILALAIPMAAYLSTVYKRKWMRMLNILFIPVIFFAIFLTGTRTGSIVASIGVIYWLYTHRKASIKIKFGIFVVFIVSIIVVINFAPKASVDRIFSAGKSLQSGDLNYRTVIWGASIKQWRNSPITGAGLGSLGDVLSREHVNFNAAHNTHLQILTESGLVGVALYILVELSVLFLIFQVRDKERAFLLTLFFSLIVSQLTLHTHIQKETWLAFTMIVIHSLYLIKKRSSV